MSSDELLIIDPQDLEYPFEVKKQISCSFQLANKTDSYVAFKIKATNPMKYFVQPICGIILPRARNSVKVKMQALEEAPADMQCNDKFLVLSVVVPAGATPKDINTEMFNKEEGNRVEECKLRVVYVHLPRPPSPEPKDSEETSESTNVVTRGYAKLQDTPSESKDFISGVTKEKQSIIQENEKLHQELELLRRGPRRNSGGVSIYLVLLIGLLGLLLGYYMKNLLLFGALV